MEDWVSIWLQIPFEDEVGHPIGKSSQRGNSLRMCYSKIGIVLKGYTL